MMPHPTRLSPESVPIGTEASVLKPVLGLRDVVPAAPLDKNMPFVSGTDGSRILDLAAVVPAAAAILDEETATGMQAARDARRSGSQATYGDPVTRGDERPLHDLHELVDALGEALPRIRSYLDEAAGRSESMGGRLDGESVPVLRPKTPVRAGQSTNLSMGLDNDDAQPAHVALYCTDLRSATGARIPQQHVTVTPSRLQLGPDAHAAVTLKIAVQPGIPPGEYSGLLLASGLTYFRAVVAIEVL